jgi:hypothetical protein
MNSLHELHQLVPTAAKHCVCLLSACCPPFLAPPALDPACCTECGAGRGVSVGSVIFGGVWHGVCISVAGVWRRAGELCVCEDTQGRGEVTHWERIHECVCACLSYSVCTADSNSNPEGRIVSINGFLGQQLQLLLFRAAAAVAAVWGSSCSCCCCWWWCCCLGQLLRQRVVVVAVVVAAVAGCTIRLQGLWLLWLRGATLLTPAAGLCVCGQLIAHDSGSDCEAGGWPVGGQHGRDALVLPAGRW